VVETVDYHVNRLTHAETRTLLAVSVMTWQSHCY